MPRQTVERELTERDWKAFYLVWTLLGEISAHGHKALETFIDAMCEQRNARKESPK